MAKRMFAIGIVYALAAVAWLVLGVSVVQRTMTSDGKLRQQVAALWGSSQQQVSPELALQWEEEYEEKEIVDDPASGKKQAVTRIRNRLHEQPVILDSSDLRVDLRLDQRRKGLLWYATYAVDFRGHYAYVHDHERDAVLVITYRFPTSQALYDGFRVEVAGQVDPKIVPFEDARLGRIVQQRVPVRRGQEVPFSVAYRSQGLDWWRYSFGDAVNRVKDFDLTMTTDFAAIDFPPGTISPTSRERSGDGWILHWRHENLISGFHIGMEMPQRLNPGPLASRISFFAPVCLGFFFVWIFVISLLRGVELHPMNYLFLGAAFFAFHLLFAYSADHLDVLPAFFLSSAVSLFLVVSYLRLVVGLRFAALEAAGSQLVYLVLFSYAHFFEGFTGLIVTIGSIITLYILMQLTGRIRWQEKFA